MSRNRYHAISCNKLRPRLEAADFGQTIDDPRGEKGRQIAWRSLVGLLAVGMVTRKTSLRQVSEQSSPKRMHKTVRRFLRLRRRKVSASKIRDTVLDVDWKQARQAVVDSVKKEHRLGNLAPVELPFGVVAIDGKGGAKIEDEEQFDHSYVQRVEPDEEDESEESGNEPYGLIRFHRTCLVSAPGTVCIDQRPIPGDTNEIGALPETLEQLWEAYNQTNLFEMIVADAGNCSEGCARQIDEKGYLYGLRLKKNTGEIHREAVRRLGGDDDGEWDFRPSEKLDPGEPDMEFRDRSDGKDVVYRLWTTSLAEVGYMDWDHARTLVRLQRIDQTSEGEPTVGNRYVVFNLPVDRLSSAQWITLVRIYWRCENNNHWPADVIWREDAAEPSWSTDPDGIIATSFFRMFGLNVISVLRAMTRRNTQPIHPPWEEAIEDMILSLATGKHPKALAFE